MGPGTLWHKVCEAIKLIINGNLDQLHIVATLIPRLGVHNNFLPGNDIQFAIPTNRISIRQPLESHKSSIEWGWNIFIRFFKHPVFCNKTYLLVQVTTDWPPKAPGPAKVPQRGLSVNSTDPNCEVSLCIVLKPTRTEISLVLAAQQSPLSTIVTLNTCNQIENQYVFIVYWNHLFIYLTGSHEVNTQSRISVIYF